jgi:DNA modification methylase
MNAGWDTKLLSDEFKDLQDDSFDLMLTGFTQNEIDELLNPEELTTGLTEGDDCPVLPEVAISKPGDVWLLGKHRLMCGNSTNVYDIDSLLKGAVVNMVFTDPPYGIDENTNRVHSKRSQVAKAGVYDRIIGDKDTSTAIAVINICLSYNIDTLVFWGANYYAHSLPETGNWLVWDKRVEENQRDYNSDAELAWVQSKANSVRIFRHLWKGMIKDSEHGEGRVHPTQKPIALAEWCFNEYAPKSKTVMDLFGGSGSTLIACEKTGRQCFMMELSEKYCDVVVKRWEQFTGRKATLESSGES